MPITCSVMFSVVCCALLAIQAVVCLPVDQQLDKTTYLTENWENEDEDGYQVILKSPSQVMKVEVVDENGYARIQEMELTSEEERFETEEKFEPKSKSVKCNWRRLYKLYLTKRRTAKNLTYARNKKKLIRDAFKVVCENPEEAITYLLELV